MELPERKITYKIARNKYDKPDQQKMVCDASGDVAASQITRKKNREKKRQNHFWVMVLVNIINICNLSNEVLGTSWLQVLGVPKTKLKGWADERERIEREVGP